MAAKFSVTYEVVTPESAEDGDTAERGFVVEDVSLRDALDEFDCGAIEPSSWPVDFNWQHTWYTERDGRIDYLTGAVETRSFHLPKDLTPSTRRRIARLLGWNER